MDFNTMDFDTKIQKKAHTIALTAFFISFLFQTLTYFKATDPIITAICAVLSVISIILSLYFTSGILSASLMLNSVIMILYVSSLYWNVFTGGYKFFTALILLTILLFSLYKILKNK